MEELFPEQVVPETLKQDHSDQSDEERPLD